MAKVRVRRPVVVPASDLPRLLIVFHVLFTMPLPGIGKYEIKAVPAAQVWKLVKCMEYFAGWSWDPNDLISSKQAFLGLLMEGVSFDELSVLDFGNLDLIGVAEEVDY